MENDMSSSPRYVVVSPVKDEERHIEVTLRSMINQTLKPVAWIIVDDGSKDRTAQAIHPYVQAHPFIRFVQHPNSGVRQPGSAVIRAFDYGRRSLGDVDYDFIVKLDCDLSFDPDYFERLLRRFRDDERLGIASGVYLEANEVGRWKQVPMPSYHAFGASKVVRRKCFDEIGGFVAAPGWDTLDEIRALHRGWTTQHFVDLKTKHHKPEGSGIGVLKTSAMHGEIFYVTGGDPLLLAFKVLRRLSTRPIPLNALALLLGYLKAVSRRQPRLVTRAEARRYRQMLRQRLWRRAENPFALSPVGSER